MKKYIPSLIFTICMTLLFTGCGKEIEEPDDILGDRIPMVNIEGELYLDTGREIVIDDRSDIIDGEISSSVDGSEIPSENNQSNFGEGYTYQFVDENSIDIYLNGKWMRFEKENTDTWGIQLDARKVTPNGLTIVCSQSDGKPRGELQTGSFYCIQVERDDKWLDVEMLPSEYERAWTAEAWHIPMNDSIEWEVNWSNLYGELDGGKYRIGKEIMDFIATGDYDTRMYYADFDVED